MDYYRRKFLQFGEGRPIIWIFRAHRMGLYLDLARALTPGQGDSNPNRSISLSLSRDVGMDLMEQKNRIQNILVLEI